MTEQEFKSVVEYTKEQLRKQYANMMYENAYGVKAVAAATIEGLQGLCNYEQWYKEKGGKIVQERFNDIANGREDVSDEVIDYNEDHDADKRD